MARGSPSHGRGLESPPGRGQDLAWGAGPGGGAGPGVCSGLAVSAWEADRQVWGGGHPAGVGQRVVSPCASVGRGG